MGEGGVQKIKIKPEKPFYTKGPISCELRPNKYKVRGLSGKVTDRTFRRRNIDHARTDVPALATFTVSQSALRAVIP